MTRADQAAVFPGLIMPPATDIAQAARRLEAGQLVAFPTETVYGLGADAENPEAVAAIYAAKGRPANHPVIVHLAPQGDPAYWAAHIPHAAQQLIDAFWPGPLTLILVRAPHIPAIVSGGQDSVGLRCPSHPVAQALLSEFRHGHGGVAGPSANRFGRVSPTAAQHVRDEFDGVMGIAGDLAGGGVHVLDGGECQVGIESTILDLSRGFPALLRPGHITPEQIASVIGEMPRLPHADQNAPRASGTLKAHYAPRTPLFLCTPSDMPAALRARRPDEKIAVVATHDTLATLPADSRGAIVPIERPATPAALARDLYALLRRLDTAGVSRILFEPLPAAPAWAAVADRLGRAAAAFESL